jgi:tetratricopeptide (TPR) repeat protein
MARFDKSSTKSPSTNAAVAARAKPKTAKGSSIEDTMFFPRLRRHAKWMFVFLALVFGLGFVIFGVGAGGVGVGDVLRDNGGASAQSVGDARKATEENPQSATAWRELATALQTDGQTDEAIGALVSAAAIAKRDASIQRELAGLYLTQATEQQNEAQLAQLRAAYGAATWNFPSSIRGPQGGSVLVDPIGSVINSAASQETNEALTLASQAAANAVAAYKKVVAIEPDDPNVQLELASTAEQTGDTATAIGAYKRFLVLSPDDPNAAIVKQQLKQLTKASAAASG